jgi:OOP family OmpA-OmpF porin
MKHKILALVIAGAFSNLAAAETKSGFELAAGFGKFMYGDGRLKDPTMGVFSVSYLFENSFQIELIGANPDTTFIPNGGDIDTDWSALRALYNFDGNGAPYVSLGVDNSDVFGGENSPVVGVGLKLPMNDNLSWRIETNFHTKEDDVSLMLMLSYSFAEKTYHAPAKAVVAVPTPKPNKVESKPKIDNLDTDMDGVFDHLDKCPGTAAKALVDENGCQKELLKDVSVDLQINFDSDQAIVKSIYNAELKKVADFMTQYAGTSVVIEGHTDSKGKAAHNLDLSTRRAAAVAEALVSQFGIDSSRVEAKGYGEDNAIANNETAAGRAENRRVVAIIKESVKEKQWQ